MAYAVTPNEAREAAFANQRLAIARLSDADAFVGREDAKRCYLQAAAAFDMARACLEYADEIEWDIPPNNADHGRPDDRRAAP